MRYFIYTACILFVFASCKTSRDYLSRIDEDKTLFDAVKSLGKHPGDTEAIQAIPLLYSAAEQRHLRKIAAYNRNTELTRWDKIITEYSVLQKMYDAIGETYAAGNLVKPINYQSTIYDLKQQAAEEYYQEGFYLLDKPGRDNAKYAYNYFKKSEIGRAHV